MNRLFITVGAPRAGKSTWAKRQNVPIVNPDSIRLSVHGQNFSLKEEGLVWYIARIMVESLFKAGNDTVILDSTMMKRAARSQWDFAEWERHFVIFPTHIDECFRRAIESGRPDLCPVIERMSGEYEPLNPQTEGKLLYDGTVFNIGE